ncbi:MAG TPA: hypothetical protein VGA13_00530 [Acidimicrobiales bacterium]|jgi:hypothetical protein
MGIVVDTALRYDADLDDGIQSLVVAETFLDAATASKVSGPATMARVAGALSGDAAQALGRCGEPALVDRALDVQRRAAGLLGR